MKHLKILMSAMVVLCLVIGTGAYAQTLVINELVSSNSAGHNDGFGDFDDWLEIYNYGEQPIDLGGMYLSTDPRRTTMEKISMTNTKWTTIQPKTHLLLWFDGEKVEGTRHIGLKLSKSGGAVGLFNSAGELVDKVDYPALKTDLAYARVGDAGKQWGVCFNPTPEKANLNVSKISADDIVPKFSVEAGFKDSPFALSLTCDKFSCDIYYTLDGSKPTAAKSKKYDDPIWIDKSTVVRARIVTDSFTPGRVITKTYLCNESSTLPVVSLTVDPHDLWDEKTGIYVNFEETDWEREAHVEYFDIGPDKRHFLAFSNEIYTRIAGKTSRRQPKRSFAFFCRENQNQPRIHYKVFPEKDISSFGSLWVRADATSGRNVPILEVGERFKNELFYEINQQLGYAIDMQAYVPTLLFLNGKYWGIYNLMERKGNDFLWNNHGIKDASIMGGEYMKRISGSRKHYDRMIEYIKENDLAEDSVYEQVSKWMDIDNYIDYFQFENYSATGDYEVNIRYYREICDTCRWKWIGYDYDSWYPYDDESVAEWIEEDYVFLFSNLSKNRTFKEKFATRAADLLNTVFTYDNIHTLVERITKRIEAEIPREEERWGAEMVYVERGSRIAWINEFARERPPYVRSDIITQFEFEGGEAEVNLDVKGEGKIKINSITVDQFPWQGMYFEDVPATITAIPEPGYRFVTWKGLTTNVTEPTLLVGFGQSQKIKAVFKRAGSSGSSALSKK